MKGREEEGRVTGVMIWATALLLPLALPPGGRERGRMRAHMGTLAHAHKWDGQQSISAAQSLPPLPSSVVRRATLGAALSLPIRTDDDVAVKLVGREKISKEEMYGMDWRTEREETTKKFV